MSIKEDIKKLSEEEADKYFICKFDELADEKGKKGNAEFANIFHKRAERLRDCSKFFWVWDKKYNELLED